MNSRCAPVGWFPNHVGETQKGFIAQPRCGRSTGVVTLAATVHHQRGEQVMGGGQRPLIKRHPRRMA